MFINCVDDVLFKYILHVSTITDLTTGGKNPIYL
jgi:hypothetical protein